jgi:hypothetical protein
LADVFLYWILGYGFAQVTLGFSKVCGAVRRFQEADATAALLSQLRPVVEGGGDNFLESRLVINLARLDDLGRPQIDFLIGAQIGYLQVRVGPLQLDHQFRDAFDLIEGQVQHIEALNTFQSPVFEPQDQI